VSMMMGVSDSVDRVESSLSSVLEMLEFLSEGSMIDGGEGAGKSRWVDAWNRLVVVMGLSVSLAWWGWVERLSKDIRRRSASRRA